jgi:hypothetical protein
MKNQLLSFLRKPVFLWAVILASVLLLTSCSSTSTNSVPPSLNPVTTKPSASEVSPRTTQTSPPATTFNTSKSSETPGVITTPPVSSVTGKSAVTVDVLYFHNNQRCVTCLCFETRITHVVTVHFMDQLSKGTLTYQVLNRQDEKNANLVKKYQPIGSQLFINTVIDGTDHIVDVQDIWEWNCRGKPDQFDYNVQQLIAKSLTGTN